VFGDGMTVETDAANTLAAAPLVFGDGMTVETDAAASLAAAPLVFGDGMKFSNLVFRKYVLSVVRNCVSRIGSCRVPQPP
jgi:hypothetical protein